MGSQVMRWIFRGRGLPLKSERVTPEVVRTASSPSARKWMLRVWWRMPGTSEARKNSPSPRPMTAGGPMRAATSLLGSLAERTPMAKAPVRRWTARRTASSKTVPGVCLISSSMRWAMISVSVSVGVGVLFGGATVGGPAGVADAEGAVEGVGGDDGFEVAELAGGSAELQCPFAPGAAGVAGYGDAGGVVAAILEAAQAFNDDGDDGLGADITNDSTHGLSLDGMGDFGWRSGWDFWGSCEREKHS